MNEEVRKGARAQRFVHSFELDRAFPCCYSATAPQTYETPSSVDPASDPFKDPLSASDITFLILSSKGGLKDAIIGGATWARGLPNVVFVSDSYSGNSLKDDSSNPSFAAHERRHLAALRYYASKIRTTSPSELPFAATKWVFVVPETSWVNVPVLLSTLAKHSSACPILLGGVRTNTWVESVDFASISSGIAISQTALSALAPRLLTESCTYQSSFSNSLGRCAWSTQSQLVHSSVFSTTPVPRTNDRHKQIDATAIAERLSSPAASKADMVYMTTYSYARYGYDPTGYLIVESDKKDAMPVPVGGKDYTYPLITIKADYNSATDKYDEKTIDKDFIVTKITILDSDIKKNSGSVNMGYASTKGLVYNETTPFDANKLLYDNPLAPVIMYPDHLYVNSNLLQNAKVGYDFLQMPYPPSVYPPQK